MMGVGPKYCESCCVLSGRYGESSVMTVQYIQTHWQIILATLFKQPPCPSRALAYNLDADQETRLVCAATVGHLILLSRLA